MNLLKQRMMVWSSSKVKGVSLIETLLVLAIVAAIFVVALQQYQRMKWRKDAEVIKASVTYLRQGFNRYYFQNCRKATLVTNPPTEQQILAEVPQALHKMIINPWADNPANAFTFNIREIDNPVLGSETGEVNKVYQLQISTTLSSRYNAAAVAGIMGNLNGSFVAGNKITWAWIPSQRPKRVDSAFWVMNGGLQDFAKIAVPQDLQNNGESFKTCPA